MTIKECYQKMGGDYDEVFSRFRKDERIQKFVLKFLDDKSYELLCESLKSENYDEAFRAAHTIKGICQNLSFTKLYQSSSQLTELLRGGKHDQIDDYVQSVKEDYLLTIEAIQELDK